MRTIIPTIVLASSVRPVAAITTPPRANLRLVENLRDQIVALSSQVPSELSAYSLLRLVQLEAIDTPSGQKNALLSAFSLAGQNPYPMRRTLIYGMVDSRSGYTSDAMALNLDTMSLRSEIVIAMLRIDPTLARQLFTQMGPPTIPPLTCSDSLIAAPDLYFQAAAQIYQHGFSAVQRATGEDADFLDNVLLSVSSGSELPAAMSLLSSLRLTPYVLQGAEINLANAINHIRGDPRTFSTTLFQFMNYLPMRVVPGDSGESALLNATRGYIVGQASASICSDEIWRPTPEAQAAPTIALSVNPAALVELNRLFAAYGISPVKVSDLAPQTVIAEKEDTGPLYFQDPTSRKIEGQYKQVRFASSKDSDAWQNQATLFLQHLRDWTEPEDPDEAESVLIEKALLYSGFINAVPPDSPLLQLAIVDYLGLLGQAPAKETDELFILSDISSLFRSPRFTTGSPAFKHALAAAMQDVPNPSVSLWAALLRLSELSRT